MQAVIYRTGGTKNFKWKCVQTLFNNYDEACQKAEEIERMGYFTIIQVVDDLDEVVLPNVYNPS